MLVDFSFVILASMLISFGSLGIVEGLILHPAFYSNSAIIFVMLGYFSYRFVRGKG